MASKSGSSNAQTDQPSADFFQNWDLAENNDVLSKEWTTAKTDDRNPFYSLYPNPSKAVIVEIASILKSSSSNQIIVGKQFYDRNLAMQWLIHQASRNPVIREADQDKNINEYDLLELIEREFIGAQTQSLAPEIRERLVENLIAASDQQAQQSLDKSGTAHLPSDHDMIELAKRNAQLAYYKTTTIDPIATNIVQVSQQISQFQGQSPLPTITELKSDAQIIAKTAVMLTNSLSMDDFQTGSADKVVETIAQQALENTALSHNPKAKKLLEDSVRQQYQQRQHQIEQIHVSTKNLAQELTTSANLPPVQAQQAAARFGEMVAVATTQTTSLKLEQTQNLLNQAVAEVKTAQQSSEPLQPVTPAKVQTVLETGVKGVAATVLATPAPITLSPKAQATLEQVTKAHTAPESKEVVTASHELAQQVAKELNLSPKDSQTVVDRYNKLVAVAQTNPEIAQLAAQHPDALLRTAKADVSTGTTDTPITPALVKESIDVDANFEAKPLTPETQIILEQLVKANQESHREQAHALGEAQQSLATHLVDEGHVSTTNASQVVDHYKQLIQVAQTLSPVPLTSEQASNLLAVAVENVKSGQAPTATAQEVSTSQIREIVNPTAPVLEALSPAVATAANQMVKAQQTAQQVTDFTSAEASTSQHEIAKFYKDYGVNDLEANAHVAKVKELVNQGYTVQDAVLKAGGKDFEQRIQDSFNTHEELAEYVQRVEKLKPYVKTPDVDIYIGDKKLVIDRFRFKGSNETISFDKALESINQVRLATGQGIITHKQLKLALIHQDTYQQLIANNPHLAGTIEKIAADSAQIREFLKTNKDILQIKDGKLLSQLVHDDNLIRLNPEKGFNIFTSRVSGTIHKFNREAHSIIDELKTRITGKGVPTPAADNVQRSKSPTSPQQQSLLSEKHDVHQPSTEMNSHLSDNYGNEVQLTGFRRIFRPFQRLFQRARAAFFRTLGNWSQMGGIRGFVGKGISWGLGKLGVKGVANNFVKGAASKVAKKVASKLAGKAAEKGLTKLVGLLGPWGKVASVIIGVVGLNNIKKILGALAGLTAAVALAPLLWAANIASKAAAAASKAVTAVKGAFQGVVSGSSAVGGLSPVIANAPIIAVGATAVAGIFTMQQLTAVFMLPPYGTSSAFFENQGDFTSYSCPAENIPSSFPTGSPVEGSGWPITAGLNVNTGASQHHNAIDIAPPTGTRVVATVTGYVLYAGWNNQGYGNLVILRSDDNAFTVYYAHLANVFVQVNDRVTKNQTVIGKTNSTGNSTGPHLHYELRSPLYGNISIACGLGMSPTQVEKLNSGCLSDCGTMP